MQKIVVILINVFGYIFFIIPIMFIGEFFYPIIDLLFGKSKRFHIDNASDEHKQQIKVCIESFANKFEIKEDDEKQKFYDAIEKLSKLDFSYSYIVKDKQYCYSIPRYVLHIIELGKDAIKALEKANQETSISYYEEGKNSTLDKLLAEYTKRLNEKSVKKKLHLKSSINEIKIKRLLAKMKKPNTSLFFNFYLTIFSLYSLNDLKVKKKDEDAFELAKDMLEFLSLGHATAGQIRKSVAIQIYYLYKEKNIKDDDLKDIISDLISMSFQTDEPYTNFNNINQSPYIKNLIGKFPLFECNNDEALKQYNKVKRIFIYKSPYFPRFFPLFFKKYLVNKFIHKPLPYYQKNSILTFFGLFPAKI